MAHHLQYVHDSELKLEVRTHHSPEEQHATLEKVHERSSPRSTTNAGSFAARP
jgi:hypothetical protein